MSDQNFLIKPIAHIRTDFKEKFGIPRQSGIVGEHTPTEGTVLIVSGADMLDNAPIYDLKPYIPYTDCHPDSRGGFADSGAPEPLEVDIPEQLLGGFPQEKREALISVLAQDPRPAYQNDPERVYGLSFAGYSVCFTVSEKALRVVGLSAE